ncbi:hypothetical protein YC2023_088590 [Brassica napus]
MQSLIILLQYRERVIFNGQNIDEEFSNNILATMLYLDTLDDSRRIYMYLNGPGGDLTPSLASYDTMKSLKTSMVCDAIVKDRSPVTWRPGPLHSNHAPIFKDLSRLKRFNSEEAIEYGLIIVRPPCIKDDAPLQDESSGLG